MEFKEIVKNRKAIRQYLDKKVPEETIRELLEITSYAVSAINLQPWKIKVVSDQETKDKLFPATFGQNQVRTCSHLFVFCADTDYAGIINTVSKSMAAAGIPDPQREAMMELAANVANGMTPEQRLQWSKEQVYIALGNCLNGAYSLGLGACPMTAFQAPEFAKILGLPENLVPTVMVAIGYAADEGMPKVRRSVDEILA
jgi:nitroreductase / dihydropteridine reductase